MKRYYLDLHYHALDTTEPGPWTIPYGALDHDPPTGPHVVLTEIPYTLHSDYSGCAVERSNCRVLLDDAEIAPVLVEAYGGHGTRGLYFVGIEIPEQLRDVIEGLETYPLISDDDHSSLESELESEAWESYGRSDFRRGLRIHADEADEDAIDDAPDDAIDALWRFACNHYNLNGGSGYQIETGAVVYFHVKDAVGRITRTDLVAHGVLPR